MKKPSPVKCLYSIISLLLAILALGISISFIPLEDVGMTANFGPAVMGKVLGMRPSPTSRSCCWPR